MGSDPIAFLCNNSTGLFLRLEYFVSKCLLDFDGFMLTHQTNTLLSAQTMLVFCARKAIVL